MKVDSSNRWSDLEWDEDIQYDKLRYQQKAEKAAKKSVEAANNLLMNATLQFSTFRQHFGISETD